MLFTKFTQADFSDYLQLVQDEAVMAMITERAIPVAEAEVDFQKLLLNNGLHTALGTFKVSIPASNTFVGLAKLELEEADSTVAELGYMLLPAFWGKGIGSHIAKQLLALAQTQAQLTKLVAIIDPKNLASKNILTKQGFNSVEFKDFDGLPGEILALNMGDHQ